MSTYSPKVLAAALRLLATDPPSVSTKTELTAPKRRTPAKIASTLGLTTSDVTAIEAQLVALDMMMPTWGFFGYNLWQLKSDGYVLLALSHVTGAATAAKIKDRIPVSPFAGDLSVVSLSLQKMVALGLATGINGTYSLAS